MLNCCYGCRSASGCRGGSLLWRTDGSGQPWVGGLGRVHRAGVHYGMGNEYYEGMAWEHLVAYLVLSRERVHRLALGRQRKPVREAFVTLHRIGRLMVRQQTKAQGARPFVPRKEKDQRSKLQKKSLILEQQTFHRSSVPVSLRPSRRGRPPHLRYTPIPAF